MVRPGRDRLPEDVELDESILGGPEPGMSTTVTAKGEDAAGNAVVAPKPHRNFTDPDSRSMKTADGSFHCCYSAQSVVDAGSRVIVANELNNVAVDAQQLQPMIEKTQAAFDCLPEQILADAGYCSNKNHECATVIEADTDGGTEFFIATGKVKHGEHVPDVPRGRIPVDATSRERLARKLKTKKGRSIYAKRKAIVEPVFDQIQTRQGKFVHLRGLDQARNEWDLIASCHNLMKLFSERVKIAAMATAPGA